MTPEYETLTQIVARLAMKQRHEAWASSDVFRQRWVRPSGTKAKVMERMGIRSEWEDLWLYCREHNIVLYCIGRKVRIVRKTYTYTTEEQFERFQTAVGLQA